MKSTQKQALVAILGLGIAFGIGLYAGINKEYGSVAAAATTTTPTITISLNGDTVAPSDVDMSQFWDTWSLLQDNYVPTHASSTIPTATQRVYGAIAGLAASYGDPYTTFFPPSDATVFDQDISGSFGGVGMQLDVDAKNNIVVTPLKDSPSQKAGVQSGDILVSIDGTSTATITVDDAVKLIRGTIGTPVVLGLIRAGQTKPLSISVVRDTINIPIINNYLRGDGVYVIELYSFSSNSADLFRDAMRAFLQSGSTKLLLDLRGNPGGYLEAAVQMASYFLPAGQTVVSEDFRGRQAPIVHSSYGYNIFANKKLTMAILIDQGSASAAEILSGALQQHGVAKLVGTRSFGKGSVQQLFDLGNGAELKVTIARWLTPNGTSISDGGLTPDIQATTTAADVSAGKDPQKDAAIQYLESN